MLFSRSFNEFKSIAGNEDLASTADESVAFDYGSFLDFGTEHKLVMLTFANLISQPHLRKAFLSPNSYYQQHHNPLKIESFHEESSASETIFPNNPNRSPYTVILKVDRPNFEDIHQKRGSFFRCSLRFI